MAATKTQAKAPARSRDQRMEALKRANDIRVKRAQLKKDIKERRPSKISMMPQGLLDVLSEDEVLDLLAYLRSAGDEKDPAFAKPSSEAAAAK